MIFSSTLLVKILSIKVAEFRCTRVGLSIVGVKLRLCKSLYSGQVAHQAGAYPGFRSMKRLRVFLLPPGWDASPSQGYPPALNSPVPIYTPGWREAP